MCLHTIGADGGTVFATGRVVDLPGIAPGQHRELLLYSAAWTDLLTRWTFGSVEEHQGKGLE